jgi:hypothetical protein
MMERPTYKELDKKISDARTAVSNDAVSLINQEAVAADAIKLGYLLDEELKDVLLDVLSDISPKHYVGTRPPSRSYENRIMASELFAFRAPSTRFNCRVYFKFTLFEEEFFLISLHQNRNKGGRS